MAAWRGPQFVAVALVFEQNGQMTMVGSRTVRNAQIEIHRDLEEFNDGGWRGYIPRAQTVTIEATCADFHMYTAEPMATMPHLDQRGIYLPDMSFRALLVPEDR